VLSAGATVSTIFGDALTGLDAGAGRAAALGADATGRDGGFCGCGFGGERARLCLAACFFAFRFFANRDRSCRHCRAITCAVHEESRSPRAIAVVVSTSA
jgi:hypothetical protein